MVPCLLRPHPAQPPQPEPRFSTPLGTAAVVCSGVLAIVCLRKRFLRALFCSIFLPEDAVARDATALTRSLSLIDVDDETNPALQELQRTEAEYVEDLRTLALAKAGLVSKGLLSDAKAQILFGNAPVLLKLNEEFLSKLGAGEQPSFEVVAAAFASLGPYFRLCAPRSCPRAFLCCHTPVRLYGGTQTPSTARITSWPSTRCKGSAEVGRGGQRCGSSSTQSEASAAQTSTLC